MDRYDRALKNLRTIAAAHAALTQALDDATEEVIEAANEAAKQTGSVAKVMARPASGLHVRAEPKPHESGLRKQFTLRAMKKLGSVEVEACLERMWSNAVHEEEKNRAREMAESAIGAKLLDPPASERLIALMNLQKTG